MADILEFRPVPGGGENSPAIGPCEIVIFPGVRIEREAFSLADRVKLANRERMGSRRSGGASED